MPICCCYHGVERGPMQCRKLWGNLPVLPLSQPSPNLPRPLPSAFSSQPLPPPRISIGIGGSRSSCFTDCIGGTFRRCAGQAMALRPMAAISQCHAAARGWGGSRGRGWGGWRDDALMAVADAASKLPRLEGAIEELRAAAAQFLD
ncbi:hypothetical protein GUJ93_ZPchr0004g38262 [Zizania palustris]|uniref:Uncharacterized protein n=1 Tax=Zizania palustris TaxID=103762 RepID=A0A8J5SHR3_ZIZPA|nr:hypothetical protein GUJ93_ZPchr0004g38262 [Zizania palustris]